MQPPPISSSKTFSSPPNKTLYSLNKLVPTPPPAPGSSQPSICFLSLWIYLFWVFHVIGITQSVTFCVWLLSLAMCDTCIVACVIPFYGWILFHCVYITIFLSTQLLMDVWVSISRLLWIVLLWALMHEYVRAIFNPSGIYLWVGLLGNLFFLVLSFCYWSSKWYSGRQQT